MSTTTTNLHLIKPDVNDAVDVSNLNDNMDIIDAAIAQFASGLYPVGSIYMSVNAVNPSTLFGGTWEQIKDTFLLAAGNTYTANSTGGQVSHSHATSDHTLTVEEIPQHNHGFLDFWNTANGASGTKRHAPALNGDGSGFASGDANNRGQTAGVTVSQSNRTIRTGNSIGQPHTHGNTDEVSNMPPYLAVYVWKRTA